MGNKVVDKIYRFSIREGEIGGVVIADNVQQASSMLFEKYFDYEVTDFMVWKFEDDDYYDSDYPHIVETYGF